MKTASLVALISAASMLTISACSHITTPEAVSDGSTAFSTREVITPVQANDSYYIDGAAAVDKKIQARNPKRAKNVILFVGDGMGISTLTAARIYAGQRKGLDGESYDLAIDTLPYSAFSKTYSHDAQIADSAATATAMTTGVKVPARTLGLTQKASFGNCASIEGAQTESLWALAEDQGLATGVISTARITHATPAATYSHSVSRDWESDIDVENGDCKDIARQFIEWPHGDGFDVALSGGRQNFLPNSVMDPEYANKMGKRADGRDLTKEWVAKGEDHVFIYDKAGFDAIDFASQQRVLGLFEPSHMHYDLDRMDDKAGEPSLAELTKAAITRLSQDEDGYILMVEAGRVDHALHAGNAARALGETVALDEALSVALDMTSEEDTLILVTADHSHTLTISGYARRNNPILGLSSLGFTPNKAADGKPYTTLGFMNGPGAICSATPTSEDGEVETVNPTACERRDLTNVDTTDKNFVQQSLYPFGSETHGGEDVPLLARGPGANMVSGVMEQNEIFHVIGRSLGLVE